MRIFLATLLIAGLALPTAPCRAQPSEEEMSAALARAELQFDEWLAATREFVGGVRFDEGDVESLLAHWDSLEDLGEELEQEVEEEDESPFDYRKVLQEPAYLTWAAERGLAPEPWLQKSMRIVTMAMRDAMLGVYTQNDARMQQQRDSLESQCAQVGEEMCARMKQALESSLAMMQRSREGWASLPEPTDAERALLGQYQGQLEVVMSDRDDEEEEDWE